MGDAICNYCGVHHTLDPIYFRKYHLCADKVWEDFQTARLAANSLYDAMRAQLTDNALEPSTKLLTLKFLLYSFLVTPLEIVKKLYVQNTLTYKPLIIDINQTPNDATTIYIANEESKTKYRTLMTYYECMNAIGETAEMFFREPIDKLDSNDEFEFKDKIDILRNSCAHADIWVETNSKIFFKDTHPSGNPVRILTLSSDEPLGRTCWDKSAAFLDDLKDYYRTYENVFE